MSSLSLSLFLLLLLSPLSLAYLTSLVDDGLTDNDGAVICGNEETFLISTEHTIPSGPYTVNYHGNVFSSDDTEAPCQIGVDIFFNVTPAEPLLYVGTSIGIASTMAFTNLFDVFYVEDLPLTGSLSVHLAFSNFSYQGEGAYLPTCQSPCTGGASTRHTVALTRAMHGISQHWYFDWNTTGYQFFLFGVLFLGLSFALFMALIAVWVEGALVVGPKGDEGNIYRLEKVVRTLGGMAVGTFLLAMGLIGIPLVEL